MGTNMDFKSLQDNISAHLVNTTRTAGQLAGRDLAFHRSLDPSVARRLDKQNARLLALAGRLTKSAAIATELPAPDLPDADAVEDNWQDIVDVIDNLLEKADACLDEYTGVIKRLSPVQGSISAPAVPRKILSAKDYKNQAIAKPQLLFNKVPNNEDTSPFKPLLRTKPHAIVPLQESISPPISENDFKEYKHPYQIEISQSSYPPSAYVKSAPIAYHPFDSTTATFVDTWEGVTDMLAELRFAKEIAVDLEHHDTHSYIGLVCLMQISTREKDWVVDTLKPWREDLQILNEVFTDPNIVKVFHGAFMDMQWLQRDLGLYVVGLFDTFHATNALGYPQHSLASLLNKFVNFAAQKQYQMADWRIRPLPDEMFNYARSDTHFLLYIYDNMRNELIDRSNDTRDNDNLIDVVLENSKKEALQKYERPIYDAERGMGSSGWYNMLVRMPAIFTKEQFAVFRAVHQWRDSLARKYDESVHIIMQKSIIYNVAREMPMDIPALLACSHPISPIVRQHIDELLGVIKRAKAAGTHGQDLKQFMKDNPPKWEQSLDKVSTKKTHQTVPVVGQQVTPTLPISHMIGSMRSESSNFWGSTINGPKASSYVHMRPALHQPDLRLALPLPQLTAEVFHGGSAENTEADRLPVADPGSRAEHRYVKAQRPVENEVFVLKEVAGKKRKATELTDTPEPAHVTEHLSTSVDSDANVLDAMLSGTSAELSAPEKAQRRAARKAQKKSEKELRKQEEAGLARKGTGNGDGTEEPFDYTTAPSVLHVKPNMKDKAGHKPAFDPYSKSLNAPKGQRRLQREVAGKSHTFKS